LEGFLCSNGRSGQYFVAEFLEEWVFFCIDMKITIVRQTQLFLDQFVVLALDGRSNFVERRPLGILFPYKCKCLSTFGWEGFPKSDRIQQFYFSSFESCFSSSRRSSVAAGSLCENRFSSSWGSC
jgi:hypothetical protein